MDRRIDSPIAYVNNKTAHRLLYAELSQPYFRVLNPLDQPETSRVYVMCGHTSCPKIASTVNDVSTLFTEN